MRLQIERRWQRRGEAVDEELIVLQDGLPPDVPKGDYQNWLNDLVPPGLNLVIFLTQNNLTRWPALNNMGYF